MGTAALQRSDAEAPRALIGSAVLLPLSTFAVGALTLAFLAGGRVSGADPAVVVLAACLASPTAAAVLLDRRPDDRIGQALSLPGLVPLVGALAAWPGTGSRPLPADALAGTAVPAVLLTTVALVALPVLLLRERPGSAATAAAGAAGTAALVALAASPLPSWARPHAASGASPAAALGLVLVLLAAAVTTAHVLVLRQRTRAVGVERDRLGWYALGAAAVVLSAAPLAAWIGSGAPPVAFYATGGLLLVVPVGVVALVLTPEPSPLDRALARVVAFVALTLLLASVYVAAVAGLAATGLPDGPQGAAVLTAAAALVAVPLWGRARAVLEVRLFGAGRDPSQVLAALEARLGADTADPVAAVTTWLAAAVRSPQVRVTPTPVSTADPAALVVPLRAGEAEVGHLVVEPRRPGERYGARDRRLLEQLALPVALVARTAKANEALARSEQRIAAERSAERRRVLDDLHDDLGPALAGLSMQLSAARSRLQRRLPPGQDGLGLLDSAVAATDQAQQVMRRLARDLGSAGERTGRGGPTSGALATALVELVDGWSAAARDTGLSVELADGGELLALPPLPPAVEDAAYRIAGEAVTNVVRHARASSCVVRTQLVDGTGGRPELHVQVEDDGPARGPWVPGVGMRSMQARAGTLGGSLTVEPRSGGGTLVTARLPVPGPAG